MEGVFDLATFDDLCAKLRRDYERVRADPRDAYAAFDFVVTAWHLLEWKIPGDKAQRDRVADGAPILRVCEHLAVGAKHFSPSNPKLQAVKDSGRDAAWRKGVWAPGTWGPGVWKDELFVNLDGPARMRLGDRLTILQIADQVIAFWEANGCQGQSRTAAT